MTQVTSRYQQDICILQSWLKKCSCMLQQDSWYIHNPLVQARSLRMFEEWVKQPGLILGIWVGGLECVLPCEESQRTYDARPSNTFQRQWARFTILYRKFAKCCYNIQMGWSLNEHIWWVSSSRLPSEDISGQQSTSVSQSAARDWLAPKTSTPTTLHCAKCTSLL